MLTDISNPSDLACLRRQNNDISNTYYLRAGNLMVVVFEYGLYILLISLSNHS
jgi:hypothetical protein